MLRDRERSQSSRSPGPDPDHIHLVQLMIRPIRRLLTNQCRRKSEQDKYVPREHLYNLEGTPPFPFLPVAKVDLQSGVSAGGQIATFRGSVWNPPPSSSLSSDPQGSNGPG
jgi:hypothetical protein